jgi:ABC-2 type transport system ATP-binding protein
VRFVSDALIEIEGLRKEFYRFRKGRVVAVDNLDLRVPSGGVFGFLGRNGAGKTTTIRCLLGLAKMSKGKMSVFGNVMPHSLPAVANRIGSVIETPAFVPSMTGSQNLILLAAEIGIDRKTVEERLEQVGLTTRSLDLVETYSLGMKQRLGLAAALIKDPELLILDEPANGLDPAGIREIRELIRSLGNEGRTVFLSSHLLSEVQQICDQVAIIDRGRLVTSGTVEELLNATQTDRIRARTTDLSKAQDILKNSGFQVEIDSDSLLIDGAKNDAARINETLGKQNVWLSELTQERISLEDLFIELTGGEVEQEVGV